MLGVSPDLLTDAQLAEACLTDEGKAGDIVGLAGCAAIRDVSCLVRLEQMQALGISGCRGIDATTVVKVVAENRALSKLIFGGNTYFLEAKRTPEPVTVEVGMTEASFSNTNLGVGGAIIISAWLTHRDNGAMSLLNLASNGTGQLVPPDGWRAEDDDGAGPWIHTDGQKVEDGMPEGSMPVGVIYRPCQCHPRYEGDDKIRHQQQ
jgi:hypothetical protein